MDDLKNFFKTDLASIFWPEIAYRFCANLNKTGPVAFAPALCLNNDNNRQ